MRSTNSSAQARRQASRHCSSVAFALPQRRLSITVPEKSTFFCSTTETASRRASRSYSRTSQPPTLTQPPVTSYRREMRFTRLDFDEPVPPMMPIVSPARMCRSMSESTLLPSFPP